MEGGESELVRYYIYEWHGLDTCGIAPVFSTDDIMLWHRVASRIKAPASRTTVRDGIVIFSYFNVKTRMNSEDALQEYKDVYYCIRPKYVQGGLPSVKKILSVI